GLRGSAALKRVLEEALPDSAIRAASASELTGNLLVSFDPEIPLAAVMARVERLVRAKPGGGDGSDRAAPAAAWHALSARAVLAALESDAAGLSGAAARERLAAHGDNALPGIRGRSRLAMLLEQFENLPTVLLAGAALVSLATGGVIDAAVILGVVA